MPTQSKSLALPLDMPETIPRAAVQSGHQPSQTPSLEAVAPSPTTPPVRNISDVQTVEEKPHTTSPLRPKSEHQTSLLNLFRKPHEADTAAGNSRTALNVRPAPVELSAQRTPGLDEKAPTSHDLLKHFLQHRSGESPSHRDAKNVGRSSKREGQTSATVSGPLNQPHFETITPSPRKTTVPNEFTRSPKPTGRTLFDPNQPPAVKILARPEDAKRSPARSPRAPKPTPLSAAKPITRSTESNKSFQPQILRRPQTENVQDSLQLESYESPMKPPVQATQPPHPLTQSPPTNPQMTQKLHLPSSTYTLPSRLSMNEVQPQPLPPQAQSLERLMPKPSVSSRLGLQDDTHRQSLLSLFNKPSMPSVTAPTSQEPSRTKSPVSASRIVSPTNEKHANGVGTISTRSRIGSIASVGSGTSQAPPEKRQTAAGDRAFLLGYLGRIASQEG
jgi:mRNA-decapping enzyme subunit 2